MIRWAAGWTLGIGHRPGLTDVGGLAIGIVTQLPSAGTGRVRDLSESVSVRVSAAFSPVAFGNVRRD